MLEDWLDRWETGRTGWHEESGNAGLRKHWSGTAGSVLVPLCGKSPDLAWLAGRGHQVVGVEISEKAILGFFEEQDLDVERTRDGDMQRFAAPDAGITIYCGDYFRFRSEPLDALYDRGALVAVAPSVRDDYVRHTKSLLADNAPRLIVTLEYEQSMAPGPPFSVDASDVLRYWPDLDRVSDKDDLDNCPPKFIEAGIREIREVVWISG